MQSELIIRTAYKIYRNYLTKIIRESKKNNIVQKFTENARYFKII